MAATIAGVRSDSVEQATHPGRKGRGVELVLGVEDERHVQERTCQAALA